MARPDRNFARQIVRVTYSRAMDRVRIIFDDRTIYVVPRRLLEGLEDASADQLKRIEIAATGPALHWPLLGVTQSVPKLLDGVYGSKQWMASLKCAPKQANPRQAMFVSERRKAGTRLMRSLNEPVIMTNTQARRSSGRRTGLS